jgi:transglutaminase/protease-like cytokinesis protein 3
MKINLLKLLPLFAALLLAIPSCEDDDNENQIMVVYSVTLDKSVVEITVGETVTVKATISPENATYKNVVWTSSDETIAEVDSKGVVTALKEGTVTITATSEKYYTKSATCTITVKAATTTNLTEDPEQEPKQESEQESEPTAILVTSIALNKPQPKSQSAAMKP